MRKLGELLGKTTASSKELVKNSITSSKKMASASKTMVVTAKDDFVAGFKSTNNPVVQPTDVIDAVEVTE